jgi:hypothetical protein
MNRIWQYIVDSPPKIVVSAAEPWEMKNKEVKPL